MMSREGGPTKVNSVQTMAFRDEKALVMKENSFSGWLPLEAGGPPLLNVLVTVAVWAGFHVVMPLVAMTTDWLDLRCFCFYQTHLIPGYFPSLPVQSIWGNISHGMDLERTPKRISSFRSLKTKMSRVATDFDGVLFF